MARNPVLIEILGSAAGFGRAVKESIAGSKVLQADMTQLGVRARASAEVQIQASLRKDARLRQEIATYQAVAASAARGSREQIVAANLAAQGQGRLSRSLGVTAVESRRLSVSSSSAERSLGHATRGALAGSGIFHSLGRSIAFASGGFLAFATAGEFVRKSLDAAREAGVTQRQLEHQLQASGKSFSDYRGQIDKTTLRLSALDGITKDQLDASFTTLVRNTGNVSKSLRLTGLAADVSAGMHKNLAVATVLVAKVAGGNTSILRRYGLEIAKGATATQGLALLTRLYGGQAAAAATEQQKFSAVLHDSEVIIGNGLLPTVNRYLTSATKWLAQMNESGKLQKDVASAAHDVSTAVSDGVTVIRDATAVARVFTGALGGVKTSLEVLGGLKLAGLARGLTTANTEAGVLRSSLIGLGELRIAAIVIPFESKFIPDSFHGKVPKGIKGALVGALNFGPLVAGSILRAINGQDVKAATANTSGMSNDPLHDVTNRTATPDPTGTAARRGVNLTVGQRNTFFDNSITRLLDRSQDGSLRAQIGKLQTISALISERIAKTKDITRKLNLEDQLVAVGRTITSDRQQLAKQLADQIKADKAAALLARQKALTALEARQFKTLGLGPTGDALTPGKFSLNKLLGRVTDEIAGTKLDTTKTKTALAGIRKVLSEAIVPTETVRAKIQQLLAGIDQQFRQHAQGNQTRFAHQSTAAILNRLGLNLSPEEKRRVESVLSQLGAGNTAPGKRSASFALAGGDVVVHTQINLDGKVLAASTTRHQQRTEKHRAVPRRGSYAGLH